MIRQNWLVKNSNFALRKKPTSSTNIPLLKKKIRKKNP